MQGKTLQCYWEKFKRETEKRGQRGKPEYPTGIGFIDNFTDGICKGQVWTIAGRSGSGKTSLALQIGRSVADNPENSVLFISLEMQGEQIASRLFCEMMKEDNTLFKKGMYNKEKDKVFTKYIAGLDFEISEQGYTFDNLLKIIKSYYTTKKPDLIIVDFAQLIEWHGDQRADMEKYIRKLTELAKTDNIAIILVSQFRRPPSGSDLTKEPSMEDMKGCIKGCSAIGDDTIKGIFDKQDYKKIKTFNVENGEIDYVIPSAIYNTGKKKCYEIITESGKNIVLSEQTELYNGKEWIETKDINVGERILTDEG